MALSLPIVSASPDSQSPSSDDGSVSPQTPVSPSNTQPMALPQPSSESQNTQPQSPSNPAATQVKRKPSRRANTAERRATHNAVERQRRETLNGRFLDLAALLPNLSQIRRPSKSAIVNSSIAHINASRRHRLLASRELRLLKLESDALRRELNEWRDRAGLPRVDEPVRGEGFTMVLSGEIEVLAAAIGEEEDETQGQYDGFEEGDEELPGPMPSVMDDGEDFMASDPLRNGSVFGHNITAGSTNTVDMKMARVMPRAQPTPHTGPMIAQMSPSVSYENPAMPAMYEPQVTPHFSGTTHIGQPGIATPEADKVSAWAASMYSGYNSQLQLQAQRPMITPPDNTHPVTQSPSSAGFLDYAYLANLKRQQMMALQHQHGVMACAIDGDDASSVGSNQSERERCASAHGSNGYASPHQGTPSGSYELSNAISDFALARRIGTAELQINTAVPSSWSGRVEDGMNGMIMKQTMQSPIHVPNAGAYGMMM